MTLTEQADRKLFSFEFLSLNLVIFFSFCNMSVFYSFFSYLARIGIPEEWRGFLVGLEPMSAFMLRLVAVPMLHAGNAAMAMLVALIMIVAALCSYGWVVTIPGLIALRVFHGAAFVLLVSASMALVVHFIPKGKSGQGFGFVSVSVLVPYAVMPLVTEVLLRYTQNEAQIYRGVTVLAVPAFVLLLVLRNRLRSALGGMERALISRPKLDEIRRDLKEPGIVLLLAVNLFLYLCYASVFFFMKGHAAVSSISEVGSFFTISTLVMIALRLSGGLFFDKIDKIRMLQVFMLLLVPCFVLFGYMSTGRSLYLMAGYYGLCIGFIMPLLNALLFDVSPPHLRGVNTNLALFVMDAGFFLSPYAGGAFIASGRSFGSLFNICAGFILVNVVLLIVFGNLSKAARKQAIAGNNGRAQ
ncbi:Major facilitator superfamily MFS_1 [Syntrophobacter sp. SbD2]|nr:Major facilitator superfamily MFS_1 [Syntrophobacter sp. SbD2]